MASTPAIVRIRFTPEADSHRESAREYQAIWESDGPRIVEARERVSGLSFIRPGFADTAITAIVYEGVSLSGYRQSPMKLRASYPSDTKRGTLMHELGHRLQGGLFRRDEEEHEPLFLWLYDAWAAVYGKGFADRQVAIEKRRRGPYPAAWSAALAISRNDRAARWQRILADRISRRR